MIIRGMLAVLAAMCSLQAKATLIDWELFDEFNSSLGGFRLDLDTLMVTNINIHGYISQYTLGSTFIFLDSNQSVGGYPATDSLLFFSTQSGQTYVEDYGGGESYSLTVNEAALRIGVLDGPLSPLGGTYNAVFDEIYNYDETFTSCAWYEEIYDEDTGEYIQGDCARYDTDFYFNVDDGWAHLGSIVGTPLVASVSTPGTLVLLLAGIAILGKRRQGHY